MTKYENFGTANSNGSPASGIYTNESYMVSQNIQQKALVTE
jgi:hypothetical protein